MKGNKAMLKPSIWAVATGLLFMLPAIASAQESFGVEVCDAFLKNYEACIVAKMPPPAQTQARNALGELRNSWKAIVAEPTTKERFPAVCRESVELVKQQTASVGCQW